MNCFDDEGCAVVRNNELKFGEGDLSFFSFFYFSKSFVNYLYGLDTLELFVYLCLLLAVCSVSYRSTAI